MASRVYRQPGFLHRPICLAIIDVPDERDKAAIPSLLS